MAAGGLAVAENLQELEPDGGRWPIGQGEGGNAVTIPIRIGAVREQVC